MHFKIFRRKQNVQSKSRPYLSAVVIWGRVDSRTTLLLSLGTNWLPSSWLHYKNCSLWFLSLCAIIFNTDQFGRLLSGNEKKKISLELKSKHISSLCLCHLLWFFWDNSSLHFFSLGVEYCLLVSDHLFTVRIIIN